MTWSHFTAYLDGSRPITKAERDELYDNFAALLVSTGVNGCSDSGYALRTSDQTAIKATNLLTDLASLDGPGLGTNTKGRLQTIIAATLSVFESYPSPVSTALTAAGITSGERDTIIASYLDDHRLWNYYRALINALHCHCQVPVITGPFFSFWINQGSGLSYAVQATNGPTYWAASGLPTGLSINASTGEITGTCYGTVGWYTASVQASNGCGASAVVSIRIHVIPIYDPPPPCSL